MCGLEDGSSDASKPVHIRQVLEAKGLILLFSLTQELSINFRVYQVAVPRPPAQTQTPAAPNLSAPGQLFLHPQVTSQVSTLLQALTQGGHSGFTKSKPATAPPRQHLKTATRNQSVRPRDPRTPGVGVGPSAETRGTRGALVRPEASRRCQPAGGDLLSLSAVI